MLVHQVKKSHGALAGVVQWIERWPANQGVNGLIPSLGTCLVADQVLSWQSINVSLAHRCFSPSLSPSLLLCLKINKILKKKKSHGINLKKNLRGMSWKMQIRNNRLWQISYMAAPQIIPGPQFPYL